MKRILVVFALVTVVSSIAAAPQGDERYKVRLSTVPMDGSMRATVAGSGAVSAVLTGSRLSVSGTFEGLRSPATVARLHRGMMTGVRGPSIGEFTVSKALMGTITGSIDLTPQQMEGLRKGQLYVQIHSEKAPDGNLWGWLLR